MKKKWSLFLCIMLAILLSGCGNQKAPSSDADVQNSFTEGLQESETNSDSTDKAGTERLSDNGSKPQEPINDSDKNNPSENATQNSSNTQDKVSGSQGNSSQNKTDSQEETSMIYAHIGDNTLEILPADNSSAAALLELLAEKDITVDMQDYGGFEKVGSLGSSLPTNDENITTAAGDVILYQGNQITIYYSKNTWNFTRLGKVQGLSADELKTVLGDGDVSVRFSLK